MQQDSKHRMDETVPVFWHVVYLKHIVIIVRVLVLVILYGVKLGAITVPRGLKSMLSSLSHLFLGVWLLPHLPGGPG